MCSHLLLLPCWNMQNLLYKYANIFAYFLLHRPVFIGRKAWKASCFHIKITPKLVSMSAHCWRHVFLLSCSSWYSFLLKLWVMRASCVATSLIRYIMSISLWRTSQEQSQPDHLHYLHLLSFRASRIKICHYLMYPRDSSRLPSSAERRSQKPRSSRKRGRSWPLQRGSWSRRAARPQLGRRSSRMRRCVKCSPLSISKRWILQMWTRYRNMHELCLLIFSTLSRKAGCLQDSSFRGSCFASSPAKQKVLLYLTVLW